MANLTATYMSRVLCKMDERKRLKDIGIDLHRSDPMFPTYDELAEIPKVSPICLVTVSIVCMSAEPHRVNHSGH